MDGERTIARQKSCGCCNPAYSWWSMPKIMPSRSMKCAPTSSKRGFRAYLGMLSVDPVAAGGPRLGRQMMAAVRTALWLADAGCGRSVSGFSASRPELPPFYRRLNFVEEGLPVREGEIRPGPGTSC
mgnify:CR=1 FL=1